MCLQSKGGVQTKWIMFIFWFGYIRTKQNKNSANRLCVHNGPKKWFPSPPTRSTPAWLAFIRRHRALDTNSPHTRIAHLWKSDSVCTRARRSTRIQLRASENDDIALSETSCNDTDGNGVRCEALVRSIFRLNCCVHSGQTLSANVFIPIVRIAFNENELRIRAKEENAFPHSVRYFAHHTADRFNMFLIELGQSMRWACFKQLIWFSPVAEMLIYCI